MRSPFGDRMVIYMKEVSICPICGKEYDTTPDVCECGFFGLAFIPDFAPPEVSAKYDAARKKQAFDIFKFAKNVYFGKTDYPKTELVTYERDDHILVYEALAEGGLAFVDPERQDTKLPTVADGGMIALRPNIKALILNTDEADYELLDESHVSILILGSRFKRFRDGGIMQYSHLRYLWADGKNESFTALDNVLFSKDMTKLYIYARAKEDEEYTVPKTVRSLERFSFFSPKNLKRLYLPRGIHIHPDAFGRSNSYVLRDGAYEKLKPEFEIIYY